MTDDELNLALAGMARFAKGIEHEQEHCVGSWTRFAISAWHRSADALRAAVKQREGELFDPACEWCVAERERGER